MKIEVRKLNAQKKYAGEFNFGYTPAENLCLVPLAELTDIKVSGSYEIFDDGDVEVTMTVGYKLKGQCSYCLEPAEKEITYTSDVLYVTGRDGDDYRYDGISIDLEPAVKDAILISQPSVLLCKEGCAGIDVK